MQIDKDLDDIAFTCYYKKTTLLKYPPQSSDSYETTCSQRKKVFVFGNAEGCILILSYLFC